MKFPGEEMSLIKTYLRSLIKTDFMEQPSGRCSRMIILCRSTTGLMFCLLRRLLGRLHSWPFGILGQSISEWWNQQPNPALFSLRMIYG